LTEAVAGTPLYPRDILTSMMANTFCKFQLPDGRILYPVTTRNQVSEALDAITQNEGYVLIRGPEFWEAIELSDSEQAAAMVARNSVQSLTGNTITPISWEAAVYEDLPCWDISDPTKLIIPANVSRMRLSAAFTTGSTASRSMILTYLNGQNMADGAHGMPALNIANSGTPIMSVSGGWVPVEQNDEIDIRAYTNNNNTIVKASATIEFG
jgi:hypothetical protein